MSSEALKPEDWQLPLDRMSEGSLPLSLVSILMVTANICFVGNFDIYLVINAHLMSTPGHRDPQNTWCLFDMEEQIREDGRLCYHWEKREEAFLERKRDRQEREQ